MHPTFHHDLSQARIADLHRQAARERAAKAAIRPPPQPHQRTGSVPGHTVTGLARRVLALAGGRGPSPTR